MMVFEGIQSAVNEALGCLNYVATTRSGVESLSITVTDLDHDMAARARSSLTTGGSFYRSHSLSLNISVTEGAGDSGQGQGGQGSKVCFKVVGACVSEKALYGALFLTLAAIFLSPLLFLVHKGLRCAFRPCVWRRKEKGAASVEVRVTKPDLAKQNATI